VAPSSGGRQVVSGEVAERVGFEPTTEVSPGKRLAGARTRPLCDLSAVIVASDEGFGHPQRCAVARFTLVGDCLATSLTRRSTACATASRFRRRTSSPHPRPSARLPALWRTLASI